MMIEVIQIMLTGEIKGPLNLVIPSNEFVFYSLQHRLKNCGIHMHEIYLVLQQRSNLFSPPIEKSSGLLDPG